MKTACLLPHLSHAFQKVSVEGWYGSRVYCCHHADAKREYRDFSDMFLMGGPL